jgi:hypothetical protein
VAASKPVAPPPAVVAANPPVAAPSAGIASKTPAPGVASAVASRPPRAAPPAAVASRLPTPPAAPVVQSGAARQFEAPARAQAAPVRPPPALMNTAPGEDRLRSQAVAPVSLPAPAPAAAIAPTVRQEPAALRARREPVPEAALPFDAVLGTILYSSGRKLAIVDGEIVGPGDEVRGARVVEITPNAVMLRDGRGRLWRLDLGVGVR